MARRRSDEKMMSKKDIRKGFNKKEDSDERENSCTLYGRFSFLSAEEDS